jgi:hypothetical protein
MDNTSKRIAAAIKQSATLVAIVVAAMIMSNE